MPAVWCFCLYCTWCKWCRVDKSLARDTLWFGWNGLSGWVRFDHLAVCSCLFYLSWLRSRELPEEGVCVCVNGQRKQRCLTVSGLFGLCVRFGFAWNTIKCISRVWMFLFLSRFLSFRRTPARIFTRFLCEPHIGGCHGWLIGVEHGLPLTLHWRWRRAQMYFCRGVAASGNAWMLCRLRHLSIHKFIPKYICSSLPSSPESLKEDTY